MVNAVKSLKPWMFLFLDVCSIYCFADPSDGFLSVTNPFFNVLNIVDLFFYELSVIEKLRSLKTILDFPGNC